MEMRKYRFAWASNFGYPLQIPKGAIVDGLAFGKLRSALVEYQGKRYITDRYALRKIEGPCLQTHGYIKEGRCRLPHGHDGPHLCSSCGYRWTS